VRNSRLIALLLFVAVLFSLAPAVASAEFTGTVKSDHVLLMDADSGLILYEKGAYEKAYPASTTKVMTCILVLENCTNLREKVTISRIIRNYGEGNSLMGLTVDDEVRVKDLLYGLMLPSGNDAAAVLAEHFGGSFEAFAEMMNEKAEELGMENTRFVNPHGLHDEDHYTTAYDMAILVRYAMQNGDFRAIVGTPSYTCPATKKMDERTLYNTNRFLNPKEKNRKYNWSAVTGVKTGFTNAAGGCFVASASLDGKNLICVILGDRSDGQERRWSESRALLEYGFETLTTAKISELNIPVQTVNVPNAAADDEEGGVLALTIGTESTTVACTKEILSAIASGESRAEVSIKLDDVIAAPISANQKLGTATIRFDGNTLGTADVFASRAVAEKQEVAPSDTPSQSPDGGSLISGPPSVIRERTSGYLIVAAVLLVLIILLLIFRIRSRSRRKRRRRAPSRRGKDDVL
jgi:D-alanyl-D-alanine carboxypeptidase (penicillin-binding protein 5/6)